MLPAMFMTAVSVSYLLSAPHPEGFGLGITIAASAGVTAAVALSALFYISKRKYSTKLIVD